MLILLVLFATPPPRRSGHWFLVDYEVVKSLFLQADQNNQYLGTMRTDDFCGRTNCILDEIILVNVSQRTFLLLMCGPTVEVLLLGWTTSLMILV
jgi:hypothetical protein